MRVQKKKSALFFLIFCFLAVLCAPHAHGSDPLASPSILDVAAFEVIERFGNQATAHFLSSFYDREGNPAVHLFLVTKDQEPVPEDIEESLEDGRRLLDEGEALIQSGRIEEGARVIAAGKALLLQEARYGTLLVSARQEGPSLVAFHHGLPTCLIAQTEAEERAEAFSNGREVTPLGVLYLSPLEYYFEFEVEGEKILASPFNSEILSRVDLEKYLKSSRFSVPEDPGEHLSDHIHGDLDAFHDENHTGADLSDKSPDSRIIPGVPDYDQRPSIANSCGPTAGACLLGYWDSQGYDDLLQGAGTYDDVTRLIEELCQAMGWDPLFGVYYSRIPAGLRHIIDDRGYEFGISNLYSIDSLDVVRQEIIQGRPFVYGSQENPWGTAHYVVVVGYEGSFIIVHDTWWSTPADYFVHWDALGHSDDMMTMLIPQGQVGPPSQPLPYDLGGSGGGCFISTASQG